MSKFIAQNVPSTFFLIQLRTLINREGICLLQKVKECTNLKVGGSSFHLRRRVLSIGKKPRFTMLAAVQKGYREIKTVQITLWWTIILSRRGGGGGGGSSRNVSLCCLLLRINLY